MVPARGDALYTSRLWVEAARFDPDSGHQGHSCAIPSFPPSGAGSGAGSGLKPRRCLKRRAVVGKGGRGFGPARF
jgi:hypothetical protein